MTVLANEKKVEPSGRRFDARQDQIVFLRKHPEPISRDVPPVGFGAVNGVTEVHVVGRHGLCDGPGRTARLETSAQSPGRHRSR